MRIGLVGVGRIGGAHAEVVAAHPGVTELLLADVDPARAAEIATKLDGKSRAVDDVFAEQPDAVVIAAATAAHADLLLRGIRAGIPVFCEKPVALDLRTTVAVRDEVVRSGATVQIGLQRRFDAGYRAARAAVRAGILGQVHRVHLLTADQEPPPASYIATSGGMFRDCHIHDFDILRWVTGREVVDVYAVGSNRGAEFFRAGGDVDNSAALLRLDDDTLVTMQGSRYNGAGHDVRMELAGTQATYAVGLDERTPLTSAEPGADYPGGHPWPNYWVRFTPAYAAEMNAFLDLVRDGGVSPCTVDEALEAFYVAEAADLSLREGRPVRVAELRG